jgi:uncharacterized alpha-E superfamily protein
MSRIRCPELLARDAEGLFWMARYLERVENLARLIDVTQSFESPGFETEAWWGLVRINADEKNFLARGFALDAAHVKRFYLLDHGNATSVPASLESARTNARTLRPLMSTEMWRQLNMFHRFVNRVTPEDLDGDALSRLCTRIKESAQAHTGITHGTLYRDQGWHFYQLGRCLECADQTTRMLDIKYTALLPSGREAKRVAELTQWNAILRAADGYHAFKRLVRAEFSPEDVVHFLLRDTFSPRSVLLCVQRTEKHLEDLRDAHGLAAASEAIQLSRELRVLLTAQPLSEILAAGLHDYLDLVQVRLQQISACIGRCFFRDWRPVSESIDFGGGNLDQSAS